MKAEWRKSWWWGFDVYPRYCCCETYDAIDSTRCKCEEDHECSWKEGPAAYLKLLIGPHINDLESFVFEISMKSVKNIYKNFYVEDLGFEYDPHKYPMKRRRINNSACTNHIRIIEDCSACQRLIKEEKRCKKEEDWLRAYAAKHSEESVLKEIVETRKAFEEKRKRENLING